MYRLSVVKPAIFFVVIIATLALCLPQVSYAQPDYKPGDAFSIARSETKIIGTLRTIEGGEFRFMVKDGGMLRVTKEETGETTGFVFVNQQVELKDAASKPAMVQIQMFSITDHPSGAGEAIRSTDSPFVLGLKDPELDPAGDFEITVEQIRLSPRNAPQVDLFDSVPGFPIDPAAGNCCIYCTGYTVCGCTVEACNTQCCGGSCCTGSGGPGGPDVRG